jgi:hypothetical protein
VTQLRNMLRCCRRASYIPFPNTAAQLSDALEVALIRPLLIFCDVQDLLHKWKLEKLPLPGLALSRRIYSATPSLLSGDSVAKVFSQHGTQILRPVGAPINSDGGELRRHAANSPAIPGRALGPH